MTIALLTHTSKQGSSTTVTTNAIDTSGANLIVVMRCMQNEQNMTDSASNTWTSAVNLSNTSETRMLYCLAPTTSTTHTFTQTGSFPALAVACFSGVKTSSPLDQTASHGVNTSTTNATGSITPSENNELLVFGDADAWTGSVSVNVGAILEQLALVGGTSFAISIGYEIQTTATARNVTWTQSNSRTGALVASFKSAPAAAGLLQAAISVISS